MENGLSMVVLAGRGLVRTQENYKDYDANFLTDCSVISTVHQLIERGRGGVAVRVIIHPLNTTALPMTEGFQTENNIRLGTLHRTCNR